MATLEMQGPYDLTQKEIDRLIPKGMIGNYAYGYKKDNVFIVQYVGRSDTDLHERIAHGINKYPLFKFSFAKSEKEAFNKECKNWHDFGGEDGSLDNKIHPDKPVGIIAFCPICERKSMKKYQ